MAYTRKQWVLVVRFLDFLMILLLGFFGFLFISFYINYGKIYIPPLLSVSLGFPALFIIRKTACKKRDECE
jgi:hypothetical protein